jgi:uncharacterized protein (DUF2252 family)
VKVVFALALVACAKPHAQEPDAAPPDAAFPAAIQPGDFTHPLDKAYIRGLQTWLDDAAFETKWTAMLTSPIEFLGSADSAFHGDLSSIALPGGEALCHGDPKLNNFGWTLADGHGVFSDNDFDDGGACPAAADLLHFLVATDLQFADPSLNAQVLSAYLDTLADPAATVVVDPATEPVWDDLRKTGVDKATHQDSLAIGGEVEVATADEIAALTALVAGDARFPTTLVDVARDVHTDGGSAGLRRFWLLVEDAQHPRTIIELKELIEPGTELGPHSTTYDDAGRFDVLKPYWWGTPALGDHFTVFVLGGRFVARDRFTRQNPDPTALQAAQIANMLQAEASLLANKHRDAWHVDRALLRAWLEGSAQTVTARWRAAYTAAGGM